MPMVEKLTWDGVLRWRLRQHHLTGEPAPDAIAVARRQIGRASCRERGEIWGGARAAHKDVLDARRDPVLLPIFGRRQLYPSRAVPHRNWLHGVFFFQAEDGIRGLYVTGVQTCALPIYAHGREAHLGRRAALAAKAAPPDRRAGPRRDRRRPA